jgi:hypothetical protein
MSELRRNRHTAAFRLSHFLNSKDSLQHSWLTATLVSILRYIHDVMDMNYVKGGQEIFNKSYSQTALFSRCSSASVKRAFKLFIKNDLLTLAHSEPRKVSIYGIGKLIETRVTMTHVAVDNFQTRVTQTQEHGSHRPKHLGHSDPLVTSSCNNSKKERRATPLSDDFLIEEKSCDVAKEVGLTEAEANNCLNKFFDYYQGTGEVKTNWNAVLRYWFRREAKDKPKKSEEVRSTVPWFNPEDAYTRGTEPVGRLLNGLAEKAREKMNGGSTNGLGRADKGTQRET